MADTNVKVTLTGDARSLIAAFKDAGVSIGDFDKKSTETVKGFKASWNDIKGLGGELGLTMGLGQIVSSLKEFGVASFAASGQAAQLGAATDSLAQKYGESGEAMVAAIQGASNGTISSLDAMQAANKAMMFGLVENSTQMADLTQIAITLGAAMGQDAAKSFDDLTTALGRQSPLILDNLGITLKLEDAHRIYADSLGKTVAQLTEEEKQQAFVNAALEAGRAKVEELGGVQENAATRTQQLTSAWSDFQVAFGGLMTAVEQSYGIMDFATTKLGEMAEGAKAYAWVINEAIPAIKAHNVAVVDASTKSILAAQSHEELAAAMSDGVNDFTVLRGALINGSKSYDEYITKVEEMIQIGVENLGWTDQQVAALIASQSEYNTTKAAAEKENAALQAQNILLAQNTQAMRLAGEAAYYQAEAQTTAAAAAAQAADAERSAIFAQYVGSGTNRERDALTQMRTAAGTMPEVVDAQKIQADIDKINFDKVTGAARNSATDTNDAFQGAFNTIKSAVESQLTPSLDDVWKPPEAGQENIDEAARRLATVSTSGFSSEWLNSLNTQFAGLDFWQPISDAMASGDEGALKAAANDILTNNVTKLWDIEMVKENVRKQLQEQNAKQQIMDTIMAELTAEGVVGAQAAAEGASGAANAGLLGQMMGDPATVASGISTGLTPAIDGLKTSLAGLGGAAGEAAAGGGEAATGNAFGTLETAALALDTFINTTLAVTVSTFQTTLATAGADGVLQFDALTTAATTLNSNLTTVKNMGQSLGQTIVTGMTNAGTAIATKLVPAIDKATKAFEKMAEAARNAASASNSAGDTAPQGTQWGGGRASGGPISAGNLYLVGERGPELFVPGSSGMIVPFRDTPPAAISKNGNGGGQSLSIGTIVLNGVQDVQALFDGIQREARNRGMQFAAVK